MKVIGLTEFGGPEVLGAHEVPIPEPGIGEVRIRVRAAAVNPTDVLFRSGYHADQVQGGPPFVPGMDAAGTLDAVGDDVDLGSLDLGDPVVAIVVPTSRTGGAYAEYLIVPAASVARAPAGYSLVEAATLPMNAMTARMTLDVLDLAPGSTIAVTGSAGAYGGYLVQLARLDGLRVVADASRSDHALIEAMGADLIVGRGEGFATEAVRLNNGQVDALADGALLGDHVSSVVRDGGQIALVRPIAVRAQRDIRVHEIYVRQYATRGEKLDRLCRLAERGSLTLRVADTVRAEDAAAAQKRLDAGGVRGRIVLTF